MSFRIENQLDVCWLSFNDDLTVTFSNSLSFLTCFLCNVILYYFVALSCVAVSKRRISSSVDGSPVRVRRISRTGSVDTLSPCESIASDDLMLDYERSEGSIFDCTAERYDLLYSKVTLFWVISEQVLWFIMLQVCIQELQIVYCGLKSEPGFAETSTHRTMFGGTWLVQAVTS